MNRLTKLVSGMSAVTKSSNWDSVFRKGIEWREYEGNLDQPYRQSIWIYRAVHAIAINIAQTPFRWIKGDTVVESGPLYNLFTFVNNFMSDFQLWEATTGYLMLQGNCIWIFDQSVGQGIKSPGALPAAIYPVSISNFRPVTGDKGRLTGWIYKGAGGDEIPLTLDQLIHFRLWNPYHPFLGMAPYEAAKLSAESDREAQKFNRAFFKNNAEPSGLFTMESAGKETIERFVAQWEQRHQGVNRAHRIGVLVGKDAKWQSLATNMKDMQFERGRRMNREEILACYGVPKLLAGLTDDLNFATAQVAKKIFWNDTLLPILKLFEDKLTTDFANRYLKGQGYKPNFDTSQVPELQEDLSDKVDLAKVLWEMGFTANELNERFDLGFEEEPWRDEPKSNAPVNPFALSIEVPEKKEPEPEKSTTKGKKLPLNTVEQRHATWNQFAGYMAPFKTKFIHKGKEIWQEMKIENIKNVESNWKKRDFTGWSKKKVEEALQKQSINDMIFDYDSFKKEWRIRTKGIITGATNEAGVRSLELVDMSTMFDVNDPKVLSWVQQRAAMLADSIVGTTKEEVTAILRQGLINGMTVEQMSGMVMNYYDISEAWKMERLARTETAYAQIEGTKEAYLQSDVVTGMEWLANPTACDECAELDGQEFDLNADGPPAHPNCECTLLPIVKEEGE